MIKAWLICLAPFVFVFCDPTAATATEPLPEMVMLPAASLRIGGDNDAWSAPDEHGDRLIHFAVFAVSRTEITVAQYDVCVRGGACREPLFSSRSGDDPVVGISWRDARAYVDWLNLHTGRHYRLLSEAEWERAARGDRTTRYWWGEMSDPGYGNFGDDACCRGAVSGPDSFEGAAPVAMFSPTPDGLHDLYGNVWEWVQDCYGRYGSAPRDAAPYDPAGCRVRVLRGGSFMLPAGFGRASARYRLTPGARRPDVGFRVAMDPDR